MADLAAAVVRLPAPRRGGCYPTEPDHGQSTAELQLDHAIMMLLWSPRVVPGHLFMHLANDAWL